MDNYRVLIPLLIVWFAVGICACGQSSQPLPGSSNDTGQVAAEQPDADATVFAVVMNPQAAESLPVKGVSWADPVGLLSLPVNDPGKDAACTGSGYFLTGGSYDDGLPYANVVRTGDEERNAEYTPAWQVSTNEGMAFAMYRWNLRGYTGLQTIGFSWEDGSEPDTQYCYWVGLADLGQDTWEWYRGPADDVLTIESFGPYRAASGEMLMIVLFLEGDPVVLSSMEAGVPEVRSTGETDDLPGDVPDYPLLGVLGSLPGAVDLTDRCAPVNDQLTWGACTAFAVGDGAYNFELNRTYGSLGWDLGNDKYLVSPKYLYINSGVTYGYNWGPNVGRWTEDVIRELRFGGIATEMNAPYNLVYAQDWGSAADADAELLRCDDWKEVPCNTWEGIETVKTVLAVQQKPLAMRIYLDDSFFDYDGSSEWYPMWIPMYGHAMCIVGYDDARGAGAFKVRNSWSDQWGDAGHVWIDYRAFLLSATSVRTWTVDEEYNADVVTHFNLDPAGTPPPTYVEATDGTSDSTIIVTWAERTDVHDFYIYRDDMTNLVGETVGAATSWEDTGVTDNFGHIYWVQANNSALSSPDVGYLATMPSILSVAPDSGTEGDEIDFVVGGTGSGPMEYAWDFGGGASPNTSTESRPTATLTVPGTYAASVTVTNGLGSDTYDFDLVVTGIPPLVNYILGKSGFSGGTANLTADITGTVDSYHWSFDGGAFPAESTDLNVNITLGAPGIYDATLEVSNDAGEDIYYFELAVMDPTNDGWAVEGGDFRRSRLSPVEGPQEYGLKWKYFTGQFHETHHPQVREVIVLEDDTILITTESYNCETSVRLLNPDGTCIWMNRYLDEDHLYHNPFVGEYSGDLYVELEGIHKLDKDDGSVLWTYDHPDYGEEAICEGSDGNLYITIAGRYLGAVDTTSGELVMGPYEVSDRYNAITQAILAPNGMLFCSAEGWDGDRFVVFNTVTGTPAGSAQPMYAVSSMTISADGRTLFYTYEGDGTTIALDTTTCQMLWKQRDTRGGSALLGFSEDGWLYVLNRASFLHKVNPETGEIAWSYDMGYGIVNRVDMAIGRDGTAYCCTYSNDNIQAILDNTLVWTVSEEDWQIGGTLAIGANGTLYCSNSGWLYALGPGSGEAFLPPVVTEVSPLTGAQGDGVTFTATLTGDETLTYAWDFGGGTVPNTSSDASPAVTFADSGIYTGTLHAENAYGHHDFEFTYEVTAPPLAWDIHMASSFGNGQDLGVAEVGGRLAIVTLKSDEKDVYYLYPSVDIPSQTSDWVSCRIEDNISSATPIPGSVTEYGGKPAVFYREYDGMKCALGSTATPTSESDWSVSKATDRLTISGVNSYPTVIDGKLAVLHGAYDWDGGSGYSTIVSYATVAQPAGETDWTHAVAATSTQYRSGALDGAGYLSCLSYESDQCYFYSASIAKPQSESDWSNHSMSDYEDLIRFGESTDAGLIDGVPVVAYSRNQNATYTLWFARSSVAQPVKTADWARHQITDEASYGWGKVGTINGMPAVLYRSNDPYVLRIAVAKVAVPTEANDWERADVDSAAKVNTSKWELIEFGGAAYVVYLDSLTQELRVAVYDY